MNSVLQRVYEIGIIPVIAFNSVDEALPLCKALMAGGLPAAEVTFRTACAEDCIKKIHEELPDMLLGAGTVLTKDQADRAMAAGASFIVAPGFDPEVCQHVIDKGGIMMPGTATAGEMQQAMNMGCEVVKFFPAEANGGVDKLKNIMIPLPSMEEQMQVAQKYQATLDEIAMLKLRMERAVNKLHHVFDEESEESNA